MWLPINLVDVEVEITLGVMGIILFSLTPHYLR